MAYTRSILVSAFLAILLIGCKKAETPPVPKVAVSYTHLTLPTTPYV